MDIVEKTRALRDEAWQAVLATSAYRAFKGLDDALKTMTGEVAPVAAFEAPHETKAALGIGTERHQQKRLTQADVAARALESEGQPLPIGRWLEKCVAEGMNIKGENPLANFRSMASRDKRFRSFTRNNMYFWWLTDRELPEGWKEATDLDLPGLSAASSSIGKEGGDGHAANNTNLAS